jgi:hypothetical protein
MAITIPLDENVDMFRKQYMGDALCIDTLRDHVSTGFAPFKQITRYWQKAYMIYNHSIFE